MATVICLAAFVVALKIMPYRAIERWLPRAGLDPAPQWRKRQLFSNVDWAARRVPGATCLPQALTGYLIFALLGVECRIRIQVAGNGTEGFRAHATLLSGADVVLGATPDLNSFVPLAELRPGR